MKNYVARQTTKDTNEEQLRTIVRRGFYGDVDSSHEGVGAALCARLVSHCHAWIDAFIDGDEDLDGNLSNLSYCDDDDSVSDKDLESDNSNSDDSNDTSDNDSDEDDDAE